MIVYKWGSGNLCLTGFDNSNKQLDMVRSKTIVIQTFSNALSIDDPVFVCLIVSRITIPQVKNKCLNVGALEAC